MARQFAVQNSCHGMPCIQGDDLTHDEMEIVSGCVRDCYSLSEAYRLRTACGAFLQGYVPPYNKTRRDGWLLVEFWNKDRVAIDKFVTLVNTRLAESTASSLRS